MDIPFSLTRAAAALSAAPLSLLLGCTTLGGSTFDYEKVDTSKPLAGVPFTINKPSPTIVRTPGTDGMPDKYSVTYSYVADPKGSFTLQIKPGLLSSVDFSMSFDAGGSLQETSAKATDQAGPVLQSLGKLALAGAALDKASADTPNDTQDTIDLRDIQAAGGRFFANPASRIVDAVHPRGRPVTAEDQAAFQDAMARARDLARFNKVKKEFFYASDREYVVLRAVYSAYQAEVGAGLDPTAAASTMSAADSSIPTALLIAEVRSAVGKGDPKPINRNRSELVATLQAERAQAEAKNWSGADKTQSILKKIGFLDQITALFPRPLLLMSAMTDMSPNEWQRRVVADLNTQIALTEHQVRVLLSDAVRHEESIKASQRRLATLQARKASVLGVAKEHARRQEIDRRLADTGESKSLKPLRDERNELDGIIAAAEAALKPKAKEVKADEAIAARHMHADKPLGDSDLMSRLNAEQNGARPKYLVVTYRMGARPANAANGNQNPGIEAPAVAASGAQAPKPGNFGAGESATVPTN